MTKTVIRIEFEHDYLLIKSFLVEKNYSFTEDVKIDSSFPFLNESKNYGEITVEGNIEKELPNRKNIKTTVLKDNTINSDRGQKQKSSLRMPLLILYAFVITILALKFWYQGRERSQDKNFTYEWNTTGTTLSMIETSSQKTLTESFDKNYNLNFEKCTTYSKGGNLISVFFDRNEDGFYEHEIVRNSEYSLLMEYKDKNNDGFFDYDLYILENGDTLILEDLNNNGYFEIRE